MGKIRRVITISILVTLFLIISSGAASAQFTSEELARRPEIENLLKNAEVIRAQEIGEGVTRPYRLFLMCKSGEMSGCWKNPKGMSQGYLEGWQYEIAAYEMDKLLGLNMIPPTVEREFEGKRGSFQCWITGGMSDLDRSDDGIEIPKAKIPNWNKRKYLQRAFDSLIGNEDRTQQNIRYTDDWRMILIDHSRGFRSSPKYTDHLMYGTAGIKEQKLIRMLPRAFVEKVKALDYEQIYQAAGPYLTEKEIDSILKRKHLLLEEIQKMMDSVGESKFLY
jgi:hypothetical protein